MSGWQGGIDIGGTFTHLNAPAPRIGPALAPAGRAPEEVDDLIHGTTLVTNAIVEDRVEPVALVATLGFEDVLDIGRGGRQHLYRLDLPPRRASQRPPEPRIGPARG